MHTEHCFTQQASASKSKKRNHVNNFLTVKLAWDTSKYVRQHYEHNNVKKITVLIWLSLSLNGFPLLCGGDRAQPNLSIGSKLWYDGSGKTIQHYVYVYKMIECMKLHT